MTFKWKLAQWFELRWWKNYLRKKDRRTYLNWKTAYWKEVMLPISELIQLDERKRVVDLGCGPAGVFISLPLNSIVAVDPLINRYEIDIDLFKKSLYPNVLFVNETIEDYRNHTEFDIVFCMNAINHVHNIDLGFDKLVEVCAARGHIVLSIDAHNFSFFKYLFRTVPGDVLHPHQFMLEDYIRILENRGIRIVKTELLKQEFFFSHYLLVGSKP